MVRTVQSFETFTIETNHHGGDDHHDEDEAHEVNPWHVPLLTTIITSLCLPPLLVPRGLHLVGVEGEDTVGCEGGSQGAGQDGTEGGTCRILTFSSQDSE